MHELLNKQIPDDDGEKADHDFDLIRHDKNCDYSDSEKGIQIDVDKIIGSTQGEVPVWSQNFLKQKMARKIVV